MNFTFMEGVLLIDWKQYMGIIKDCSKWTEISHLQLLSGAHYLYSEKENVPNSIYKKLLLCHTEVAIADILNKCFS